MEIIAIKNEHLKDKIINKEYGCVCPNCDSVFIFTDKDVSKPKMLNPTKRDCRIACSNPDCRMMIRLDNKSIVEFINDSEKEEFKSKHNNLEDN